ncbi:MAG: hypothetical protein PVI95_01610 [Dehalococcoidia bacterium]|jgi:hypothetical protein
MNCTVCGNPLLFDRVVFHCSCGAFVHAYCWDEHVLQAHQPSFEIGSVNLDGEFIARESEVEEQVAMAEASEEASLEEESPEEQGPEEQNAEEQTSEEQTTPLLE